MSRISVSLDKYQKIALLIVTNEYLLKRLQSFLLFISFTLLQAKDNGGRSSSSYHGRSRYSSGHLTFTIRTLDSRELK